MGGTAKGGGGTPQGQGMGYMGGKGAGGTPQQQVQTMQQQANAGNTMPAGVGDPRAADMMARRQALMSQYQTAMAGRPGMGGGIAGLANMDQADFMPGGSLAAPLDLGAVNPNPAGATPAAMPPQMNMDAMNRMRSQMGRPQGWGPGGRFGMGGYGGFGGSRGNMYGGMGRGMMPQSQPMANGGIVSLADGGRLGAPISRGGVSYAPAIANRMAPAMAAAAAAPTVGAPRVAWTPGAAAPAGGGSMFSGIDMAPITQPAAYVPQPQAAIWQPPAKVEAPAGKTGYQIPGSYRSGPIMGNWLMEAQYAKSQGATPEQIQQLVRRGFSGGMRGTAGGGRQ